MKNPEQDEISSPNTRPDAVNITIFPDGNLVEVFKLKPISCKTGFKNKKAKAQIERYINKIKNFFPDIKVVGGNINIICNESISFPDAAENATITFTPDPTTSGLYYYQIMKEQ